MRCNHAWKTYSQPFSTVELLQVLIDAAVGHAEQGENVSYAVYVAAKLQRPEDVCRLWVALQPCVPRMSLTDIFNVLWACARLHLGSTLDLEQALDRLGQLLSESHHDSTAHESAMDMDMELDPFEAAAYASQSESRGQLSHADDGPRGIPGWLTAQIAWSLAEMQLAIEPAVAENLFKAVR
jgi:hypothetical protein